MIKHPVRILLLVAYVLFLAHAVLPHEHEGGHVADILPISTHSHHDQNTTAHHHDHENDGDHHNESEDFCLLENVILARTTSLSFLMADNDNELANVRNCMYAVSIFNVFIEPPEQIPDLPGISYYIIMQSNPNFSSCGLRAPPLYS
ncbi:MAG: hypothetical protein CVU05_11310 [Bacteroidetes bacterium HGW-Bacteroidetes-21]|jgi:hypothetical protein|nr:MAG: hypothetical protein CVU05_11310 [Bacteroidetes bacterium HGW-Bacteroidetes-21]